MRSVSKYRLAVAVIACWFCASSTCAQDPTVCAGQSFPDFCFINRTLDGIRFGEVAWGDLDGDGDLDLATTGNLGSLRNPIPSTQFFRNDGDIAYLTDVEVPNKPPPVQYENSYVEIASSTALNKRHILWDGALAWADYNGDARLDLLVTGVNVDGNFATHIFSNNGEQLNAVFALPGYRSAKADWGDYDNDGDLDVALTGIDESLSPRFLLLENDVHATGFFVELSTTIPGVVAGSLDWGDYDRDGDLDLLLAGVTGDQQNLCAIYRNDGGAFTDAGVNFPTPLFPTAAWGDYDSDGDLDVVLSGGTLNPFVVRAEAAIHRNDGGSFTEIASIDGRFMGTAGWADYDNDGDLDAHLAGGTRIGGEVWSSFTVNSGGSFAPGHQFGGGLFGGAEIGDYDGDGDLDLMVIGQLATGITTTQAWRNEFGGTNDPPSEPTALSATVSGDEASLSWSPASDAETPSTGLTYNVRIGWGPGGQTVMPAHVSPAGTRLLSDRGNVDHNTSWTIRGLDPGTYYWSVQAIDHGLRASAFATESTFTVDP